MEVKRYINIFWKLLVHSVTHKRGAGDGRGNDELEGCGLRKIGYRVLFYKSLR